MADLIAHVLRRAGFDTTPDEYDSYQKLSFDATLDRLVNYEQVTDDFEQQHASDHYERKDLATIQLLWLNRMLTTKRPLQEKMTLFWHGLFATANYKVNSPDLMWKQNQLFRIHALSNFRTILMEVAQDAAMLKWLDGDQNRKGRPNENFAREVMELFTLGIGNYTEQDIKEVARALTGWQVSPTGVVAYNSNLHDGGSKTFLGRTGNFTLNDVVDAILAQPAHATFLARRLFTYFANDHPSQTTIDGLAQVYTGSNYEIKPLVFAILRSPEFTGKSSYRARIKSPIELVLGTYKKFGIDQVPKETPLILRRLGQEPFNPPTVKGWEEGAGWISTSTMLDRFNFANTVSRGRTPATDQWIASLKKVAGTSVTAPNIVDYLAKTVLHGDLTDDIRKILIGYLQPADPKQPLALTPDVVDTRVRAAAHLLLSTPVHQLN